MKTRMAVAVIGLLASAAPAMLRAQDGAVPNREAALEVRKQFMADLDTLQSKFLALANAFPANKYSWRPSQGVRSVGEVFMHVASEYYVYAPMAYGATRSPVIPRGQDSFKKFESASTNPTGVSPYSGWPVVLEPHWRKDFRSSRVRR